MSSDKWLSKDKSVMSMFTSDVLLTSTSPFSQASCTHPLCTDVVSPLLLQSLDFIPPPTSIVSTCTFQTQATTEWFSIIMLLSEWSQSKTVVRTFDVSLAGFSKQRRWCHGFWGVSEMVPWRMVVWSLFREDLVPIYTSVWILLNYPTNNHDNTSAFNWPVDKKLIIVQKAHCNYAIAWCRDWCAPDTMIPVFVAPHAAPATARWRKFPSFVIQPQQQEIL